MGESRAAIEALAGSLRRPSTSLGGLTSWTDEELQEFRQLIESSCAKDGQSLDAEIDRLFWLRALRFWLRRQRGGIA